MKNIKNYLLKVFVFIAVFGFAGNVYASKPNISVTGLSVESKTESVTVGNIGFDDSSITSNAILKNKDDYVTYKITIKNGDKTNYSIKDVVDDNTSKYVKTTYEKDKTLSSGKTANIYMTFKLEKLVDQISDIDDEDYYNLGKINIQITLLDSNNNSSTINITNNPKTSDNIGLYVFLLSFALVGIVASVYLLKNNKKSVGYLVVIGLFLITVPTFASQKYDISLIFNQNNIKVKVDTFIITRKDTNEEIKNISKVDNLLTLDDAHKDGYIFLGWATSEDGDVEYRKGDVINEDHDLEFYPVFEIIHYDLTLNKNGGTADNLPTSYTVEDEVVLPDLTKPGYTFTGWTENDGDQPQKGLTIEKGNTGDKEFDAHFTINTYSIKFHDTETGNDVTISKDYHTTLSNSDVPTVSKTGYTFEYWSLSENGEPFDFNTPIESDMTLYSVFKVTQQVVTLRDEGNPDAVKEVPVNYGSPIDVDDLVGYGKNGYTLKYWKTDNNEQFDPNTPITGPISLTAVYEINDYAYTVDNNNGSEPITNHYNVESNDISLDKPSKPGYNFIGWTGSNGNTPDPDYVIVKGTTGNLNFVANYEVKNYNVVLVGTDLDDMTYNVESPINIPTPTKEGYRLKGWSYEPNATIPDVTGNNASLDISKAEQDIIRLYPVWEEIVTVTINKNIDLSDFVAGNSLDLTAVADPSKYTSQITWSSSNDSIATISNGHLVSSVYTEGDRSVTITASVAGASDTITIPIKKAVSYLPSTGIYYSSLQKGINAVSPSASTDTERSVDLIANTTESLVRVQNGRRVYVDFKNHTLTGGFRVDGNSYGKIENGTISNSGGVGLWTSGESDAVNMNISGAYGILASDPDESGNNLKKNGVFLAPPDPEYYERRATRARAHAVNCNIYGEGFTIEVRFDSTVELDGCTLSKGNGATMYQIPNPPFNNGAFAINGRGGIIRDGDTTYDHTVE